MKNLFRILTLASVLTAGVTFAADEAKADKPPGDRPPRGERGDRAEAARKEMENLTPEERAAKQKEMAAKREAKLKELQAKKAAGTLTEKEQTMLDRLEKGGRPGGPGGPGGRRPGGPGKGKPAGEAK